MSRELFHRPTRITTPVEAPPEEVLAAPPPIVEEQQGPPIQMLLPIVGAMTSVIMMVVLRNGQPLFLVLAGVMFLVAVVGGVGFALSSRGRAARQARFRRGLYLDYLERFRERLRERAQQAKEAALLLDPEPAALASIVRDPARLWERRRGDADALAVRVGTAPVPWFDIAIPDASSPTEPADPILVEEAALIVKTYAKVEGMPLRARLRDAGVVSIIGDREQTLPAVRALLLQLATHHSPDDLQLAAAFAPDRAAEWRGFDLLPHTHDPKLFDGPVPARRIAEDGRTLVAVLGASLADRMQSATASRRAGTSERSLSRLVVVLDEHGQNAAPLPVPDRSFGMHGLGITVIHLLDDRLQEPDDVDVRIELGVEPALTADASTPSAMRLPFDPDAVSGGSFEAIARSLSAMRLSRAVRSQEAEDVEAFDITELLGFERLDDLRPDKVWKPRRPNDFLRVPFAVDDGGRPVHLDLKESAQLGMGPHGICVGATGSGKSEMLRTLILALAIGHPPEDLSMILVDYKGGAAFAPFAPLPHLAGLIDNLADDPQLTTRARASLQGEVVRRQQMLKDADSAPNITHYRQMRAENPAMPPMPHLFVVIDEFGELLTAEPDFVDLFLQIGRIGRSIGVHLLLSSQRIEAGKLRGLDTYLSYRLGLRTFSEGESQVVLSTPDAFHLPALPGYGFLKVDTSVYQRFRAGYVSGPIRSEPVRRSPDDDEPGRLVYALPTYNGIEGDEEAGEVGSAAASLQPIDTGRHLVDEAVERLRSDDRTVAPVWVAPLPTRLALGQVLDGADLGASALDVVIGLEDRPEQQAQDPWRLDLTRAGGHVWIVGAPGSGRSTLLRTIGTSLALTKTPREVAIYGMDLTGGGLRRLEHFPHVGGVATRGDRGRLRRLLEELAGMVARREQLFKEQGIDSMAQLRTMHAAGRVPGLDSADIVLLVDGYGSLRQDFDELDDAFTQLMARAASHGVHLILAMTRSSELRMAHQSLFGTRIELHLNDPADSVIDRKLSKTISKDAKGRALTDRMTLAQVALPTLELVDDEEVADALEALGRRTRESWSGPAAAPIRLLPLLLDPDSLPDAFDEPDTVPLGLRQDTMTHASWDLLDDDQHLIVMGDAKSGKSTVLRLIAHQLVDRFSPEELAIAIIDTRGHVPEGIPDGYLAAHAKSVSQAQGLATSIAAELAQRQSRSAAERASAPRIVLLVDDYDIVSAGGTEPLAPLLQHLPAARDLRFHLVIARPIAGASRALYSSTMQMARDTGGSMLLLSGDRAEGQILPRLYPERFPPGRGRFARRGVPPFVVQVANLTEVEPARAPAVAANASAAGTEPGHQAPEAAQR